MNIAYMMNYDEHHCIIIINMATKVNRTISHTVVKNCYLGLKYLYTFSRPQPYGKIHLFIISDLKDDYLFI